jgi:hypothetical protein
MSCETVNLKTVKLIDITDKAKMSSEVSVRKSNINNWGNVCKNVTLAISVQPL